MESQTEISMEDLLFAARQAVQEKRLDTAANIITRALENEPDHIGALDLLGFVRFFQKQYTECEQCCRRVLELKPGHAYALSGLGMALARQDRLEEGVKMLEQAMAAKPAWPEPYWDLAVILIEAGDKARAAEVLNQGKVNAPNAAARFDKLLPRTR
jgi:Flp pilus assembly protein TadD